MALIPILVLGAAVLAQEPAPVPPPPAQPAPVALNPAKLLAPAEMDAQAPEVFTVRFDTTAGDIIAEIHREWAPRGADRFYNLAVNGFYTNTSFFRIVPGFVVQFGISPYPKVAVAWYNAVLKDDSVKKSNSRGRLVFAAAGRNTRTTQIFINLGDNASLDREGFAPFGDVVDGMEVVKRLYGGYGDIPPQGRGPDPKKIILQGKTYLDKEFPKLDRIKATYVAEGPAPRPEKTRK